MKNKIILLTLLAMLMPCAASAQEKIPAFPDAEGGGMWATGARGGENMEVYHVTNLNDKGAGSFRDAVSKGNRFVVFDVGGNINITSRINIREDNITILGQTAPGNGISIDGEGIVITGDNVIMRYLRVRRGGGASEGDTLWISRCSDIMIDHCSFSWSVDECVSFTYVKNLTVQWSIISEALNSSTHSKGTHGYGGIWGGINTGGHHNLFASNTSRNPRIGAGASPEENNPDTDGLVNVTNNVIYNWGGTSAYGGENGVRANFIGNYYKPGPASKNWNLIYSLTPTASDSTSLPQNGGTTGGGVGRIGWSTTLFVDGNYLEGNDEVNADNWKGVKVGEDVVEWKKCESISDGIYVDGALKANDEYMDEYPIITHDASSAYREVLKYVGASLKRDAIDERVINDVINSTAPTGSESGYGLIDMIEDVGGFVTVLGGAKERDSDDDGIVDSAEAAYGLDESVFDSLTIAEDGYTMLEKYAEALAVHEGEEKADKTELREAIYSAQRIDKYGYTKDSWSNMLSALDEAKETVSVVYATQMDIDSACFVLQEAVSALEIDAKYDLRVAIDKANLIDSAMYTMDSYLLLMNAIDAAQAVYADAQAGQADVDIALERLISALDGLESYYGYELKELIGKMYSLNQADYTYESMSALVECLREAEAMIDNADNAALEAKYDELIAAYDSLVPKTDDEPRYKGDFEDFVSFRILRGIYGGFTIGPGDSIVEVARNVGDNPTKAMVFRDNAPGRSSLAYKFDEKLRGMFMYEGDFYFEEQPNTHNILLRLADNEQETPNYFTLLLKSSGKAAYLRLQYFDEEIDFKDAVIEMQKWYRVRVIFDTETKEYHIWINGEKAADGVFSDTSAKLGIDSYAIATPGGASQTMAVDNLSAGIVDEPMIINHEFTESGFVGDVLNCEGMKIILAGYSDGRLMGVTVREISSDTESVDISVDDSDVKKVFLWKNEMEPVGIL